MEKQEPAHTGETKNHVPARVRVFASAVIGVVAGIIAALVGHPRLAFLVGWDVTALVFCGWIWATVFPLDAKTTERLAEREDPGKRQADVLLLGASLASLVAVGVLLVQVGHAKGIAEGIYIGLGVVSVILSWCVVHTRFTLHYAHLYYSGQNGGVDFSGGADDAHAEAPAFLDFAYLAFTIGMTFQVSDTSLQTRAFRAAALQHALLSYLFGTVIIATTINFVAGLSK